VKNLFLLIFLGFLLFVANKYFRKEYETKVSANHLQVSMEFESITLPNVIVRHNHGTYFLADGLYPVDTHLLNSLVTYLQKIQKETPANDLTENEIKEYLKESIQLTYKDNIAERTYRFGRINPYSGRALLEITENKNKTYYFIRDENPAPKAYKTLAQAAVQKYAVLKQLVTMSKKQIFHKQIFTPQVLTGLETVVIKNNLRPLLTLEINEGKTYPESPNGIKYKAENIQNFAEYLMNLKADEVYPISTKVTLKKYMGMIELKTNSGKSSEIKLYQGLGSEPGYYVHANYLQFVYKLRPLDKELFFFNAQDFWDLTWKLPSLDKKITIRDKMKVYEYPLGSDIVSQWLLQTAQIGQTASQIISENDKFRKPKPNTFVLALNVQGAEYKFYYDQQNWYVYDSVLKQYFVFDKAQIPPGFNQKKFLKDQYLR
jgi:hypothetical protein